jgi:ADP-heptose:LPS heptosyltransferase
VSFFPSIVIDNPFHIGDNVILEPICSQLSNSLGEIYLLSDYSEVFIGHPNINARPRNWDGGGVEPIRSLDVCEALRSTEFVDGVPRALPNKLKRIYKAVGLSISQARKPQLYLTKEEQETAMAFRKSFTGPIVGVALGSRSSLRTWSNTNLLITHLLKQKLNVVAIGKAYVDGEYSYLYEPKYNGLFQLTDAPLREVMACISTMDIMVGPDTGLLHIAGAFNVPIVVIGYSIWSDLYEPYSDCTFLGVHTFQKNLNVVSGWRAWRVIKARLAKKEQPNLQNNDRKKSIAIMQLEGLGGSVGLIDHAKKVYDVTGEKPYVLARKYEDLFKYNPYIEGVSLLGMLPYEECIPKVVHQFKSLAVIKTGVGRWFGDIPVQDYPKDRSWDKLFENYPIGTRELERYNLNFIQTANLSLGLPYEKILTGVKYFQEIDEDIPDKFILVSNGVDTWHKGLEQTKSWPHEYWESFVASCELPVVQAGTKYDRVINGAFNLCGKTTVPQLLTLLSRATIIVCTEGGIMHLAYAVGNLKAVVLRGPTRGSFFHYPGLVYVDSFLCGECYWDTEHWYKDCPRDTDAICMRSITPERLLVNIERVLDEDMVQNSQPISVQLGDGMEQPALCL